MSKIVLITGAGSGMGRELCCYFAERGWAIAAADISYERAQKTVEELSTLDPHILAIGVDTRSSGEVKNMLDACVKRFGQVDALVNNAGIGDKQMPINECSFELYDKVVKVDQYSVFYMSKFALEHMEKQGFGSIVNVSSIGSQGVAGISYSAAKAAVNSMTKNIAILYADTDIRCNAVAPGPTVTPLLSPEKMGKSK